MGKIILWIAIFFVALFALRLLNFAKAKQRRRSSAQTARNLGEPMVRCVRCGVYLPRAEATAVEGGYRCRDGGCKSRA